MPLDLEDTLARSHSMGGPLGAVAFTCLEALVHGGATHEERDATSQLFLRCFAALSDDDCNVLAEVVSRRLSERPPDGRWYGDSG